MATDYRRRWATEEAAVSHFEKVRWGDTPVCPYCQSERLSAHASKDKRVPRRQCQDCHRAFSATVGTVLKGSHVLMRSWLLAIAALTRDGDSLSVAQLSRDLQLPYKTVWSMVARLREAMKDDEVREFFNRLMQPDVANDNTQQVRVFHQGSVEVNEPVKWGEIDALLAGRSGSDPRP
jgi:transposase-like protein